MWFKIVLLSSYDLMIEINSIKGKGVCSSAADAEEECKLKQKSRFKAQNP